MNATQILDGLGLSNPEIRTYLGLLELGEAQTGELCRHIHIPSSKIYIVLNKLIEKGLVTYTSKNNIKTFLPTAVESLKELFEKKRQCLEQEKIGLEQKEDSIIALIRTLKKIKQEKPSATDYKYFEGIAGIKSMYLEILEEMEKQGRSLILKIHGTSKEILRPMIGFFDEFHKKRIKNRIGYRLILAKGMQAHAEKRKKQLAEVKLTELNNAIGWGIFGDIFFFHYTAGKNPYGILVKDELTARTFEMVFDRLWDSI